MDTMTLFGPLLCGIVLSIEWEFSCESTYHKHKFVCPSNIGEAKQILNILKSCLYFVSFTHLSRSVWPNFQGNKRNMSLGYSWIVTPLLLLDLNQRLSEARMKLEVLLITEVTCRTEHKDVWEVSILRVSISLSLSHLQSLDFSVNSTLCLAAIRH